MDITAIVLRGFLDLTRHEFIFPLLVLMFYFYSSQAISRVIVIFLFGMLLNALLKYYFFIPLPKHLGPGWAFPSGHMFAAIALWGSLAYEVKRGWFYALTAVILSGIGCGLVYFNYHSVADVLGALGFASLMLAGYYLLLQRFNLPLTGIGIVFIALGAVFIAIIPLSFNHLWLALGALVGFVLGRYLCPEPHEKHSLSQNAIQFGLSLVMLASLSVTINLIPLHHTARTFVGYALLTLLISWAIPRVCQNEASSCRKKSSSRQASH